MTKVYVVTDEYGAMRVAGSRVSLDSIVYAWRDGDSPETIRENFPSLTLAQVYGAITHYLENQAVVDEYLHQGDVTYTRLAHQWRDKNPELHRRLDALRNQKGVSA